jgi:hypothetical protein
MSEQSLRVVYLVAGTLARTFKKVAPDLRALRRPRFAGTGCSTGQHFDAAMSEVFYPRLGDARPTPRCGGGGSQNSPSRPPRCWSASRAI